MEDLLKKDIEIAQRILSGSFNPLQKNCSYHTNSVMYRFTNEDINLYQKYLKNRDKVLTVTASADQIFNSILMGSKNIDSFDISRFPKYLYELKKAAILSLSKEEYLDFFIDGGSHEVFDDDIYFGISSNLDGKGKKFWDSLFNFFDGSDIYYSLLFSNEVVKKDIVVERNPYLEEDNYTKLKEYIKDISIKHHVLDIKDISSKLDKKYDLINLSSIFYYSFLNTNHYIDLLSSLPLSEGGLAITYWYNVRENLIDSFQGKNFTIDTFSDRKEGVLVYKKVS